MKQENITAFVEERITARQARAILLSRAAECINGLIDIALGLKGKEQHPEILLEIVKKMIPEIKLADDRNDYRFGMPSVKKEDAAKEFVNMAIEGKISLNELQQGMDVLRTEYDISELGQLLMKLESLNDG